MSLTKARKIFEQVQEDALESGDTASEGIAAGLIELSKGLTSKLNDLEREIKTLQQRVARLS